MGNRLQVIEEKLLLSFAKMEMLDAKSKRIVQQAPTVFAEAMRAHQEQAVAAKMSNIKDVMAN